MKRVRTAFVALLGLAAVTAGTIAVAPPAGAAKKPTTITVLVTNDDGVSAPGIDALVQALRTSKNTKVVVVAPATNQSGSGGKTTPGHADHRSRRPPRAATRRRRCRAIPPTPSPPRSTSSA